MAGQEQETVKEKISVTNKLKFKSHELKILHHNVQSLSNKL